jgi:hypothetical protein
MINELKAKVFAIPATGITITPDPDTSRIIFRTLVPKIIVVVPSTIHALFLAGTMNSWVYNDYVMYFGQLFSEFPVHIEYLPSATTPTSISRRRRDIIEFDLTQYAYKSFFVYAIDLTATSVMIEQVQKLKDYKFL